MGVLRTKINDTEIKCLNMPYTNTTLVVVPNYKGLYISFMIRGKRIAEDIVSDETARKKTYNRIKKEYKFCQEVLA
jgi:hypothetical protein